MQILVRLVLILSCFIPLFAVGEAEASGLDWRDVDWTSRKVNFGRVKTGKEFQSPFFSWNEKFIENLWEKAGMPVNGRVFSIKSAKQAIANACLLLEMCDEVAKKVGKLRPRFSPRDFRKCGIRMMDDNNVPRKFISEYQGHIDEHSILLSRNYLFTRDSDDVVREQMMLE